ncbi:hypothetical protein SJAG_01607 [Schizosaccharomyces japonicus yFS275]|uniref:Uncharacterized protein n=1 Tax=Schizosaccharomyces japonicus (strain yFS275 / FY16936) TaxID=402676 RepID=B6JYE6_SCHJY|nr:hypothetical protein SJAG_01607 [Schizosaccharomyces japonicus yFS275]EEB06564.1 hypothetical protein SJAG_01607 [Schizosaccharomyces japonicus yFS275]
MQSAEECERRRKKKKPERLIVPVIGGPQSSLIQQYHRGFGKAKELLGWIADQLKIETSTGSQNVELHSALRAREEKLVALTEEMQSLTTASSSDGDRSFEDIDDHHTDMISTAPESQTDVRTTSPDQSIQLELDRAPDMTTTAMTTTTMTTTTTMMTTTSLANPFSTTSTSTATSTTTPLFTINSDDQITQWFAKFDALLDYLGKLQLLQHAKLSYGTLLALQQHSEMPPSPKTSSDSSPPSGLSSPFQMA